MPDETTLLADECAAEARAWLDKVSSPAYREHLVGTLGLQPSLA